MKPLRIIAGVGIVTAGTALLLASEIPLPFLSDVIKARVEADTGSSARIEGSTRLRLLPTPTLSIGDITLLDDKEPERLRVESVRVALSLDTLLSGRPRLTEITFIRPVLQVPLLRQRRTVTRVSSGSPASAPGKSLPIYRVVIQDGTVALQNRHNGSETLIERINLAASIATDDGRANVDGSFQWGGRTFRTELKTDGLRQWLDGQAMPVALTLQAPEVLAEAISATVELRLRNSVLSLNGITGQLGQSRFNGWANIDFAAGKPIVTGDVDFDRLRIAVAATAPRKSEPQAAAFDASWSRQDFNLDGLNFFDAEIQASASEFVAGAFRLAPIAIATRCSDGQMRAQIVQAKAYGGEVAGVITIDAAGAVPAHAMQLQIRRVGALPLLTELAEFSWLEGEMEAFFDLKSTGASQFTIISTLAGTADARIRNGAVRGVDISKLMRDVTKNILTGWQQSAASKTDLAELSAQWRLQSGIATTDNLQMAGPIVRVVGRGSVDLPRRTLQLKVDSQLVKGLGGSTGSNEPIDLGVSVAIQGPWSEPRIYPDVAGILDDPDRIYARLRALGSGLFGDAARPGGGLLGDGTRPGSGNFDQFIKGIGDMFNIPLIDQRPLPGGRR